MRIKLSLFIYIAFLSPIIVTSQVVVSSCDLAFSSNPIVPILNIEDFVNYECVEGNLDIGQVLTDSIGGCDAFYDSPTVWARIEIDSDAEYIYSTVTTDGNWQPVWSIWSGTDCTSLEIVDIGGVAPCSNQDNTIELHQVGVVEGVSTYWIAIAANQESIPIGGITNDAFNICISTSTN